MLLGRKQKAVARLTESAILNDDFADFVPQSRRFRQPLYGWPPSVGWGMLCYRAAHGGDRALEFLCPRRMDALSAGVSLLSSLFPRR